MTGLRSITHLINRRLRSRQRTVTQKFLTLIMYQWATRSHVNLFPTGTARFAQALRCAHSFAHSLLSSWDRGIVLSDFQGALNHCAAATSKETKIRRFGHYIVWQSLGKGNFAKVYLAKHKVTQTLVSLNLS